MKKRLNKLRDLTLLAATVGTLNSGCDMQVYEVQNQQADSVGSSQNPDGFVDTNQDSINQEDSPGLQEVIDSDIGEITEEIGDSCMDLAYCLAACDSKSCYEICLTEYCAEQCDGDVECALECKDNGYNLAENECCAEDTICRNSLGSYVDSCRESRDITPVCEEVDLPSNIEDGTIDSCGELSDCFSSCQDKDCLESCGTEYCENICEDQDCQEACVEEYYFLEESTCCAAKTFCDYLPSIVSLEDRDECREAWQISDICF